MPFVKLVSSDNEVFDVDVEVAKLSGTMKTTLEQLPPDRGIDDDDPLPLPNINASTLRRVLTWCNFHRDDSPPPEDDENRQLFASSPSVWDQEFLKLDQPVLFELMLAAHYLDIKGLQDACCLAVAHLIKGHSPEEIRRIFNIKSDYTPQEEEQVKAEIEWCQIDWRD